MCTETEDVKTDLIGKLYLFKKVLQTLGAGRTLVCGSGIHVRESVKSEFHGIFDPCGVSSQIEDRAFTCKCRTIERSVRRAGWIGSPRHAARIFRPADIHGIS